MDSTKTKKATLGDEDISTNPRAQREGKRYIKTTQDEPKSVLEIIGTVLSWIIAIITFPISVFVCFFRVNEFDRAIIFRLGRVRNHERGPGLVWHLPCIDSYCLVDLRTRVKLIPSQDVITKDSVTISVDAVLFYCIRNSMHATIQISNIHSSTIFIAQTTLRNMVGGMTLHDLLISREILSESITIAVGHATEKWGVKIERVELKNISLPQSLQRSLASEAEALREARAKIISAEGELSASKALQEASEVMAQNELTLQLRHLSTLTSLAQEHQLTVIYPFPLEMMAPFSMSSNTVVKKNTNKYVDASEIENYSSLQRFASLVTMLRDRSHEFSTPVGDNQSSLNSTEIAVPRRYEKASQTSFED